MFRKTMPNYSNHSFSYDHNDDVDSAAGSRANYRRKSGRGERRRSRKRTQSTPACTINGRRNRRWAW
ncbi:MAG: hypothetical protein AAF805_12290 [Planctomycetota bacterium]